ncbi:MAG TPA: cytochrome d ubiquinol oxidase subunit II [Solirubrobacteraceae bacterium]|jgi:cytochrome d ubiquinol oxidase subunit II|nr:cytochrome d ubiquinol oxidase subunit II [Solirubrobacteraceae bacterium]
MHLYDAPAVFVLVGAALYVVLGGADFGAALWQLLAGGGERGERLREHAHRSMAPVWEANHVWLIFILTITWTAYPVAFGSIASTLAVPLFIAAVGIIFRGATYALRSAEPTGRQRRLIDTGFSISSIIAPFALGAAIGAIAARRVPVGNAAGALFSSWLNPIAVLVGVLAVAFGGYLAAVYLAADAVRSGDRDLEDAFRARALIAGVIAGGVAAAGLIVLASDAHHLYRRLVEGPGLPALLLSVVAGVATLWLVWARRFREARWCAALAVAAVIAGWGLAQQPLILPRLTLARAAAGHDTLVAVIVVVLGGAIILLPSLALLFRLALTGRLDDSQDASSRVPSATERALGSPGGLFARAAAACLIAGFGLLTIADAAWAHAVGVTCLFGFVITGYVAIAPHRIAGDSRPAPPDQRWAP